MDKVVGDELRDLGGVIDRLFGRGRSKRKKVREAPAASQPALTLPPDQMPANAAGRLADACAHDPGAERGAVAMRVIAGTAGGMRLAVPETDVRPTMDRVKAAIFSSLHTGIVGARVLDLFAGTGALGIEALSRGAASALFVEENRAAVLAIEQNFARTKLRGPVRKQEVFAFLESAGSRERFDIIFADPPYEKTKAGRRIHAAAAGEPVVSRPARAGGPLHSREAAGRAIDRCRRSGKSSAPKSMGRRRCCS